MNIIEHNIFRAALTFFLLVPAQSEFSGCAATADIYIKPDNLRY